MREMAGLRTYLQVHRARRDHADKAWLQAANDERRGMQMLGGAMAIAVLAILGLMLGLAGAEWWTDAGLIVDQVATRRGQP